MNIKTFIKIFILLVLVDLIWLKLVAQKKYKVMIKDIQGEDMKVKMLPAFFVYILNLFIYLKYIFKTIRII